MTWPAPLASPSLLGAEEAWELLLHPELRKHAVKWHYREGAHRRERFALAYQVSGIFPP